MRSSAVFESGGKEQGRRWQGIVSLGVCLGAHEHSVSVIHGRHLSRRSRPRRQASACPAGGTASPPGGCLPGLQPWTGSRSGDC